jgi:hypothetical protein
LYRCEGISLIDTVCAVDNPNTTQTLEYTKDKYNVKIIVSPKVSPKAYIG